jgi:hypothetical protein
LIKINCFCHAGLDPTSRVGIPIIPITITVVGTREIMTPGKYRISYDRRVRIFISDAVKDNLLSLLQNPVFGR